MNTSLPSVYRSPTGIIISVSEHSTIESSGRDSVYGLSTVVKRDRKEIFAGTAARFAAEPALTMKTFIDSLTKVLPAASVSPLEKGGKRLDFGGGVVLLAWPDSATLIQEDDGGESMAWSSDEWSQNVEAAEVVMGELLNCLALALEDAAVGHGNLMVQSA